MNLLWQILYNIGQTFIFLSGQILRKNPAIWSHWIWMKLELVFPFWHFCHLPRIHFQPISLLMLTNFSFLGPTRTASTPIKRNLILSFWFSIMIKLISIHLRTVLFNKMSPTHRLQSSPCPTPNFFVVDICRCQGAYSQNFVSSFFA